MDVGLPFNELLGLNSVVGVLIVATMLEPVRASIMARRAGEENAGGGLAPHGCSLASSFWCLTSRQGLGHRHLILRRGGLASRRCGMVARCDADVAADFPARHGLGGRCRATGLRDRWPVGDAVHLRRTRIFGTPPLDDRLLAEGEFVLGKGPSNSPDPEVGSIVLLLCTPTFALGLGHLVGAVLGTRQLLRHPTDVRLGIIPVLHALAATVVVNTVTDGGVDTTVLSGAVLGMEAAVLLLIGMTRNDPVTGWLDAFAPGVERSRDTMGVLGLGYLVASVLMLFAGADTWTFKAPLIALICLSLGINGFGANGASWQRPSASMAA